MLVSSLVALAIATTPALECRQPTASQPLMATDARLKRLHWDVDARQGVGTLHGKAVFEISGPNPSKAEFRVPLDAGRESFTDVSVTFGGTTTKSKLETDPIDAQIAFSDFAESLRFGSYPASKTFPGGQVAGAVFASYVSSSADIKVAFPCINAGRTMTAEVKFTVESFGAPYPRGERFNLPSVEDQLDDDGDLDFTETIRFLRAGLVPAVGRTSGFAPLSANYSVSRQEKERFFYSLTSPQARFLTEGALQYIESERGGITAVTATLRAPGVMSLPAGRVHLIFVVDKSVSFGADAQAIAWKFAAETVRRAPPQTRYSVVEFSRHAFISQRFQRDADWLQNRSNHVVADNGSNLSSALKLARALASDRPHDEVVRMIVLSDVEVAPLVTSDELQRELGLSSSVTHLVIPSPDLSPTDIDRVNFEWQTQTDTESAIVAGVGNTGGIVVDLTSAMALNEDTYDATERENSDRNRMVVAGRSLFPHLIAPQRIDGLAIISDVVDEKSRTETCGSNCIGLQLDFAEEKLDEDPLILIGSGPEYDFPSTLLAGEGLRVLTAVHGHARKLRFEGRLWTDKVSFDVVPDAASARALPGVIATKLANGGLKEDEGTALASLSGAVTPWTARLGLPSWRAPVVEDLRGRVGEHGFGCGCCGGGSSSCGGASHTGFNRVPTFERALLAAHLELHRERCRAGDGDGVSVTFSLLEILAVTATAKSETTRSCLEESFWSARLDDIVERHWHTTVEDTESNRTRHFTRPQTISVGFPTLPPLADGLGIVR